MRSRTLSLLIYGMCILLIVQVPKYRFVVALQRDTGVIVLREDDENIFKLNGKDYLIEKAVNYEGPMFDSVENTPLEGKIRVFGTNLTYIGEEILDLAVEIPYNPEIEKVFELGLSTLAEDGVRFTRR